MLLFWIFWLLFIPLPIQTKLCLRKTYLPTTINFIVYKIFLLVYLFTRVQCKVMLVLGNHTTTIVWEHRPLSFLCDTNMSSAIHTRVQFLSSFKGFEVNFVFFSLIREFKYKMSLRKITWKVSLNINLISYLLKIYYTAPAYLTDKNPW